MIGAYICVVFAFVFIIIGAPTFLGFGLLMSIAAILFLGLTPEVFALDLWSNIDSYTLLALPLFIYAGSLMTEGNSSRYLVDFINTLVRQFRGGLGMVVILSCGFFAAMSGSIIATAAAIGMVMHKMMVENGYSKEITGAMISAGATLGPIIPPSIWMIIYCEMAEENVAKMFMAGFLPGVILMVIFILIIWLSAARLGVPKVVPASWQERGSSFVKGFPALITPLIILGGIYGGIFTPTEAGAVACVWAFIIGIFVYKGLNSYQKVFNMSRDAAYVTANILLLIATAVILGAVISRLGIPSAIASFIGGMGLTATGFLLVFSVLMILFGMFMEAICIMVITVPMLLPTALAVGVDPIQFGMVLVFGLGVGQLTPPLGITLFTVAKFTEQPSGGVFKAVTPLTAGMIVLMFVVAIFPQLSLWLPSLWMG
ncbi:C4-dicarboxylate TRAP transporter large permease protein DctM [subsurface metagenome]